MIIDIMACFVCQVVYYNNIKLDLLLFCMVLNMKAKITKRDAKRLHAYCVWYWKLRYMLRYETPQFYYSNQYGRRADFYKLEDPRDWKTIRISTWYWPIGDKYLSYKTYEKREERAMEIDKGETERERKKKLRILIFDMIKDA